MAGKTKSMSQIKQMLQLFKSGKGIKTIVRLTGLARNTVKSYIAKLEKMPFSIDQLLVLDDPVLENIREELLKMDINTLTPIEALMKLNSIKKMIGR